MLERIDRHPDGYRQVREIMAHYRLMARAREDERLLELWPKQHTDAEAVKEFNRVMMERAEKRGVTQREEVQRWQAEYADRLQPSQDGAPPMPARAGARRKVAPRPRPKKE